MCASSRATRTFSTSSRQSPAYQPERMHQGRRAADGAQGNQSAAGSLYACPLCPKVCSARYRLLKHIAAAHPSRQCCAVGAAGGSSSAVEPRPRRAWDEALLFKMAEGRVRQHVPRDVVDGVKDHIASTVATLREQVLSRVRHHLDPAIDAEALLADVFDSCRDLTTRDSELDRLRKSKGYVQPVRRYLGENPSSGEQFYAYDMPLGAVLKAMFETQPETLKEVKDFAEKVMGCNLLRGEAYDPDLVIADTIDGCKTGEFVAALRCNDGEVPLVFMLYYDGLEVVNGLGQARLTHELGCFYWALIPLQQHHRLNSVHLRVATLCYKRAISEVGMHTVLHGRPEEATDPKCNAWGLWMKRLGRGYRLQMGNPSGGEVICRGGTALLAADTPAAAECMGTKKAVGPKTKSICRGCHCQQLPGARSPHRSPNSFLAGLPGWRDHCKGRKQNFPLRSDADLKAFLAKGQAVLEGEMSMQALQDWYQSMGVNEFASAMAGVGCPMDIMHILFEGVARQQLGALAYVGVAKWGWDKFAVGKRLTEFAKEQGMRRSLFPYINSSRAEHLSHGQEGGLPSSDCSFPGNAGQLAKVMLHAPEIFAPLVGDHHKSDMVWQVTGPNARFGSSPIAM